jgi:hypothetical protein
LFVDEWKTPAAGLPDKSENYLMRGLSATEPSGFRRACFVAPECAGETHQEFINRFKEGSMAIPWSVHIPQAMQQHGARRTWHDITERDRLADLKVQAAQPNRAEDEAGPPTLPGRPAQP